MDYKLPLLLISADGAKKTQLVSRITSLQLFDIDTAYGCNEAISKLRENNYHFIISDIDIGEVDGWCLSSLIRSNIYKCDKKTPIVLLTSTHCERIAEATAKSFGINAVLTEEDSQKVNEILADAFSSSLPVLDRLSGLSVISNEKTLTDITPLLEQKFFLQNVSSAKEGLALIRQQNFDFLIIDSHLDNEAAMPLLQTIRYENLHIPIVMLTPKGNHQAAENFILHGASDFIYLPFNPKRVINICERAARRNDFMVSNKQFANKVNLLEQSELKFKSLSQAHTELLENLTSVVIELDNTGHIKFVNQAWFKLTGYPIADSINKNLIDFIDNSEFGAAKFEDKLDRLLLQKEQSSTEEVRIITAHNTSVWVEIKFKQKSQNHKVQGLTATIDNIDDRKKAEEKLQHLALHDTLTGLYNRYYFDTELNRLTLLASRGNLSHCLLYIDLDHFKVINDTEGHQMGDLVLKEVAHILSKRLRNSDILCRVGGDEFVILLAETQLNAALDLGDVICKQIADAHFQFGNNSYKISASIGVSDIDGHSTAQEYLRRADVALYVAKNKGRNRTHCYSEEDVDTRQQNNNMQWVHRLQEAVVNDNLVLHLQPVLEIKTNEVAYFEALVRLNVNGSLAYPNEFIPALERAEDIYLLDHQVINKSIELLAQYDCLHKIAINLSAHAFSDESLVPLVKEKLNQHSIDGNRIIFELTESASLTNVSGTRRMIKQLSQFGCKFSIDDFGTGFSTFAYLKELPAQSVKIDGSFVKDMVESEVDSTLVHAIADVAHSLGKTCVAEFVENKAILDKLREMDIHYAQGYYISKPLTVDQACHFKYLPE